MICATLQDNLHNLTNRMTQTNALIPGSCWNAEMGSLPTGERAERRQMRVGVLTELLLSEIMELSMEEADDGVKAKLIQCGVNVGKEVRQIIG